MVTMMELTDREKAIISLTVISNQQKMTREQVDQFNTDYLKCLNVDVNDLTFALSQEIKQAHILAECVIKDKPFIFDDKVSSFTKREKYIFYECVISVSKFLSHLQKTTLLNVLRVYLLGNNFNTNTFTVLVLEQIQETVRFIKYKAKFINN